MTNRLLEADFSAVDLSTLFNAAPTPSAEGATRQSADRDQLNTDAAATSEKLVDNNLDNNDTAGRQEAPNVIQPTKINDWEKYLKDLLTYNKSVEANARKSDSEIENQFFTEFFSYFFRSSSDVAELTNRALRVGRLLQKDIKILGFSYEKNLILSFLKNTKVQSNLLKTGLLNAETYKAIHNAVANRYMADSEFKKVNDYNIIYCRDFYSKPARTMEEYLIVQQGNLGPQNYPYTKSTKENNKKIFFYVTHIKEQHVERRKEKILEFSKQLPKATEIKTTLNSVELAKAVAKATVGYAYHQVTTQSKNNSAKTKSKNALLGHINTVEQLFVTLQHISMLTGDAAANEALENSKFNSLRTADIVAATKELKQMMSEVPLVKEELQTLVPMLLDRLKHDF